jgi:acyl-CoA hydrolase
LPARTCAYPRALSAGNARFHLTRPEAYIMQPKSGSKKPRSISAAEAAALVRSGDWIDYGISLCQPDAFDVALAARKAELRHVKFRSCLSMRPRAVIEADPQGEHFFWFSWHFSGYDRRKHDAGLAHYIPCNLGEIPDYYRRSIDPIRMAVLKTCPMDENGFFNFGATQLWQRAVVERAEIVIVEVCETLPYVYGRTNGVHSSEVDYIIAGDNQPTAELPSGPPSAVDRAVGRLIAAEIEDGACLQIGIGGMPNAVCSLLAESSVRNLGVHTEMLSDGIIDLYKAGRVTGAAKKLDPGKSVFSFALGTSPLYAAIDRNKDFACCPVEYTNMPDMIRQNDKTIAINNTTQMDLQGQAASESDGHRHLSGTGGQLQFVRGAYAAKGGKSFICLSSTYEKHSVRKSRIVLNLTPGNVVTAPRSDMMYVATEYGLINLKGKSVADRAKVLISIAHPDFRESLERDARENRLIPRHYV